MKSVAQRIGLTGGVNLNRDPRVIRPDQLALSRNAWPVTPGILGKRNGFGDPKALINTTGWSVFPLGWALAPENTGFRYVMHYHAARSNSRVHIIGASSYDNEDMGPYVNGVLVQMGDAKTNYEPVKFVNYRGNCIAIVPGMEGYYMLTKLPNNTWEWTLNTFKFNAAIVGVQNSQLIPVTPRNGCQFRQRMVWGNFGLGMGSWIAMADKATSTVLQPAFGHSLPSLVGSDVLSLNGRHIEVGAIDGEYITAMQEVTLGAVGSALESVLMLLTERSCVFISGEILQTNDTGATDPNGLFGTYKEHRVNYECGCVAQSTLTKTPYGWIWAGPDDVWLLSGNFPIRIGTNIRPALLNTPPGLRRQWSAGYANGVYVLQLVTGSSSTLDGYTGNTEETYYQHQYWYLDLRDGPPPNAEMAKWFGPMEHDITADAWYVGKLLSVKDSDGQDRVLVPSQFGLTLSSLDVLGTTQVKDQLTTGAMTGLVWQPDTEYALGDIVLARNVTANAQFLGHMWVCSSATGDKLSGSSDPAWTNTPGDTVVDDALEWTEITAYELTGPYFAARGDFGEFTVDIRPRDSLLEDMVMEKLVRRVDVNVAASRRMELGVRVIKDQGTGVHDLGTDKFGPNPLELDFNTLNTTISGVKSVSRTFRPDENELIQCRHAQLSLEDSTSYIIDDSNDALVIRVFTADFNDLLEYFTLQIRIAQGSYSGVADIMQAIVNALNGYKDELQSALSGDGAAADLPNDPWSFPVPGDTYFQQLLLSYNTLSDGLVRVFAPAGRDTDSDVAATIIGDYEGTLYLSRSKRLCAILGFDAQLQYNELTVPSPFGTGVTYNFAQENGVVGSPLKIDGVHVVSTTNPARFDIPALSVVVQPKATVPFEGIDRS